MRHNRYTNFSRFRYAISDAINPVVHIGARITIFSDVKLTVIGSQPGTSLDTVLYDNIRDRYK